MASKTLNEDVTLLRDVRFLSEVENLSFLILQQTSHDCNFNLLPLLITYILLLQLLLTWKLKRFVTDNAFQWFSGKSAHETDHCVTKCHSTT